MKNKFRIAFLVLLFLAIVFLIGMYFFSHDVPVMEPDGMIGRKERDLFLDASVLMLVVVIPTIVLGLTFAWKYRASNKKAKYSPKWDDSPLAEAIWWCIPLAIIIVLGIITWKTSHDLNPYKPLDLDKKPLVIQVVALDWKWLFIYPDEKIATINYIQIPTQTPIAFQITADAPMNSFWIPKLGGQIYAMPAMATQLHLIADKEGSFRGHSANISGTGFAGMNFIVDATSDEAFEKWTQSVKESDKTLDFESYRETLIEPSQNNSPAFYNLTQDDLFEKIIMQYGPPV